MPKAPSQSNGTLLRQLYDLQAKLRCIKQEDTAFNRRAVLRLATKLRISEPYVGASDTCELLRGDLASEVLELITGDIPAKQ
jgi:hypothetical protein